MARDFPKPVLKKLYTYYVRPILECASPSWNGSLTAAQANALERVQESVARNILRASWRTPKSLRFCKIEWSSLRWRRDIARLLFIQADNGGKNSPLSDCMFPFSSARSHWSTRKPKQLLLPITSTTSYLNSFFYRSAILWISLPHSVQILKGKKAFRDAGENYWSRYKYRADVNN